MKATLRQLVTTAALACALANCGRAAVRYVDLNSANPMPPFTSWATAATNIQDAVDAAVAGDEIPVTNGFYRTGGHVVNAWPPNRVAVTKPLTVRSVNGPLVTVIQGHQLPGTTNGVGAIRCVHLTSGASLSGFTLTKVATRTFGDDVEQIGGGMSCDSPDALVSNCVLTGNAARHSGGGAYFGHLINCTLSSNAAGYYGGGAADSVLAGVGRRAGVPAD